MKTASIILFFLLFSWSSFAGDKSDMASRYEQDYLELNYYYENVLGIHFDTMQNIGLYSEIYQWIGAPYHYSGNSKDGIDCSGFVSHLYSNVYSKQLAASSRDIYRENIAPLKSDELKEGDMVFFRIRRKCVSHVGVYLGNNLFAHASRKHGVIISSLKEPYYAKYFYKGGRLKNQ